MQGDAVTFRLGQQGVTGFDVHLFHQRFGKGDAAFFVDDGFRGHKLHFTLRGSDFRRRCWNGCVYRRHGEAKRDSSLRRPTASQERSGKKKRRPAAFGMTGGGCAMQEVDADLERAGTWCD
jgi:hypothetical protein